MVATHSGRFLPQDKAALAAQSLDKMGEAAWGQNRDAHRESLRRPLYAAPRCRTP